MEAQLSKKELRMLKSIKMLSKFKRVNSFRVPSGISRQAIRSMLLNEHFHERYRPLLKNLLDIFSQNLIKLTNIYSDMTQANILKIGFNDFNMFQRSSFIISRFRTNLLLERKLVHVDKRYLSLLQLQQFKLYKKQTCQETKNQLLDIMRLKSGFMRICGQFNVWEKNQTLMFLEHSDHEAIQLYQKFPGVPEKLDQVYDKVVQHDRQFQQLSYKFRAVKQKLAEHHRKITQARRVQFERMQALPKYHPRRADDTDSS